MNIYDLNNQNDFLNAQVMYIGMNTPIFNQNEKTSDNNSTDSINLSKVLTWGFADPSISFDKMFKDSLDAYSWAYSFIEEVEKDYTNNKVLTRKVDIKNKKQWLD